MYVLGGELGGRAVCPGWKQVIGGDHQVPEKGIENRVTRPVVEAGNL